MARARNIKPGFFKNEDLAECSAFARLCFAGLWTLADREGRLEDRAKKIKGELFPFDSIEVEPLLQELVRWGFIKRYQWAGVRYIQIAAFVKHQVPHGTEKDGQIPDEEGFLTVHERGKNGYATGASHRASCAATVLPASAEGGEDSALTVKPHGSPDAENSGLTVKEQVHNTLIPDSLIPDSSNTPHTPQGGQRPSAEEEEPGGFVVFYAAYPRKKGRKAALKAWLKLAPDDVLQAKILGALAAQRPHLDKRENGRFIPHPSTWLNEGRWDDELPGAKAAAPLDASGSVWWQAAGFDSVDHAANERCHVGNFREYRDARRISEVTA
ncbi:MULTISPECIES: phage replication protein [unclassified Variovorax]|uniref:phage replication protein n=1 Tax=unclassified Variovorax TaxID=663243 RepID=UPI00076DC565|nr:MULTISPECIES: phage replication protein [unclassified Variovorax]KWT72250.1 hypothetical protein APY03_6275 [Variovorax sp. WDL1]PNG53198.1 hypothetical protein CHC06_04544 [Variovorax sp. B2]PNG53770.1 hypothetical protein CHC07_03591 [Variovorax sp. B4]VTV11224.1 hypothetical protein WDL1CHR_02105 [Variovorax sp. WDL1]